MMTMTIETKPADDLRIGLPKVQRIPAGPTTQWGAQPVWVERDPMAAFLTDYFDHLGNLWGEVLQETGQKHTEQGPLTTMRVPVMHIGWRFDGLRTLRLLDLLTGAVDEEIAEGIELCRVVLRRHPGPSQVEVAPEWGYAPGLRPGAVTAMERLCENTNAMIDRLYYDSGIILD